MRLAEAFDIKVVEPRNEFDVGPFHVATAPMRHSVPTIGVRIEANGATLAYSADTGPTDELVNLARGADVLVAEASCQEPNDELPPIHLTAREAGRAAADAGAGRLVLTHIRPYVDSDRSREDAQGEFDGGEVDRGPGQRDRCGWDHESRRPGDVGAPPGSLRDGLPRVGRGLVPVRDGQDPRPVRGVLRAAGPQVPPRHRPRVGDRRVRDAAPLHLRADPARGVEGPSLAGERRRSSG